MNESIILGRDGVALNAETNYNSFPVEPLNAVSNLVFLIIIYYWIKKVRFDFARYPLIVPIIPVIFVGCIAGIIHHLFRTDKIWNTVTMLAILYSVMMLCIYLWYRITGKWMYAAAFTMITPVLLWITTLSADVLNKLTVSVIFAAFSIAVVVPAMILCIKMRLKYLNLIALSSFLFFIGILCRIGDMRWSEIIPRGTHFLWHLLGSLSVFIILRFVYLVDNDRAMDEMVDEKL